MNALIYAGLPAHEQHLVKFGVKISDPMEIIDATCLALNIQREYLESQSRKREFVEARQIAIGLILIAKPNHGLKKLGEMLGGRDHSTMIYARENFNDLYNRDKDFTRKVNAVKQLTNSL